MKAQFVKFAVLAVLAAITSSAYPFAGGSGTSTNPYQISTKADLEAVDNNMTAYYVMVNDIDLSGFTYYDAVICRGYSELNPIGFRGNFNGAGFKITGLRILSTKDYNGFIGHIASNGRVSNLGIEDCDISGTREYIGGLCGSNSGSITDCYSTGAVSGNGIIGGLCGYNSSGTITGCYSTGAVSGTDWYIGGLCGYNSSGTITGCYSTGAVSGVHGYIGGLCGRNSGSITDCYSTGAVSGTDLYIGGLCGYNSFGTITNSYWDTETSGMYSSSGGGVRLTTAQMQTQGSFVDWDFADTWFMPDGWYPLFSWQPIPDVYTVMFDVGEHGTITSGYAVQTIASSFSAKAPMVQAEAGWIFTGWDTSFSNVTSNLTVTALYDKETYTVVFSAGAHGSITGGDAVLAIEYGNAAVAPTVTANEGYEFTGWDTSFSNVTSNLTVTALYDKETYTVVFSAGAHGSITGGNAAQAIEYGDDAVAPTVTANEGYEFAGWDTSFSNVTSNLTVTALYDKETYTVVFSAGAHGSITGGDAVLAIEYGNAAVAPTVTANEGYEFTGWDTSFSNVTSDLAITALYDKETYTVVFSAGAHGSITGGNAVQTVEYGSDAVAPTITANERYEFTGWDTSFSNVTSDLTVTALYDKETYTVVFSAGAHGSITGGDAVQAIEYGNAAVAPTVTANEGYEFTGWDTSFSNVTSDLTVTALYDKEIYTVVFSAGVHGSITGGETVQTVEYGNDAIPPTITANEGYEFTGWDIHYRYVSSDLTITAQYTYLLMGGGSGTPEDPYRISTKVNLENVNRDLAGYYVLESNIDLSGNLYSTSVIAHNSEFTGSFDGAGFKITGLAINCQSSPGGTGLFECIGLGGSLINISIEDCEVSSSDDCVGMLCGASGGTITNCRVAGVVNGDDKTGGMCGVNSGAITGCGFTGTVSGTGEYVGGLCGYNGTEYAVIQSCCFTGTVNGGIFTGGLCGENDGTIAGCYSMGSVNGHDGTGGLCGANLEGNITDCYSMSSVHGHDGTGGLCGLSQGGNIVNCYSAGEVSGNLYPGGLCGGFLGSMTGCYWNAESSGQTAAYCNAEGESVYSTSGIAEALTTIQMHQQSNFAGWDFYGTTADGSDDVWFMPENSTPLITALVKADVDIDGSGTVDTGDLALAAENWLGADCEAPLWCRGADVSMDGEVNLEDLAFLAENWLTGQ